MEFIFDIITYIVIGFFALIALLVVITVVITVVFGKRIEKEYDLEAEFHDEKGKEFAEFDLSSWRYQKEGGEYQFKASFKWRDSRLALDSKVEVLLENQIVLQGTVEKVGNIRLNNQHIVNQPENPQAGQQCQIRLDGEVVLEKALAED